MNTLTHKYDLFILKPDKNIMDIEKHFIHVNHMRTLYKFF